MANRPSPFRKVAPVSLFRSWIRLWWTTAGVLLLACGGSDGSPLEPEPVLGPEVILAAGNIATCGGSSDEATAALLENLGGTVFTLGDNVLNGSIEAYEGCYQPSWGRYKNRTYAVLGNHEYASGTAAASFDYFGDRAGPRDLGYYSMDLGSWHIILLNIHDYSVGEELPFEGSAQDRWLEADLAASSKVCTVAMWHAPRFFSSNAPNYTSNSYVTGVWNRLYEAGVDVVLNGHQHHYERFPPMSPTGARDDARGIRQFNAGSGGESVEMPIAFAQHSEVLSDAFGVLKLTLDNGHYTWEFVPVVPGQFSDNGSGTCH
jgi:acid phosphatase type 7